MNLRIKLRKNQSTFPTEKLTEDLRVLEILGESLEELPSLEKLTHCKNLFINCPQLRSLPALPPHVEILKIRGGQFEVVSSSFSKLEALHTFFFNEGNKVSEELTLPQGVRVLDLSNNKISCLSSYLFKTQSLQRLTLDRNNLHTLPEEIFSLKNLNHLSLDHNPLTQETIQRLNKAFGVWF